MLEQPSLPAFAGEGGAAAEKHEKATETTWENEHGVIRKVELRGAQNAWLSFVYKRAAEIGGGDLGRYLGHAAAAAAVVAVAWPYLRFRFILHPEMMSDHFTDLHSYWVTEMPLPEAGRPTTFVIDRKGMIRSKTLGSPPNKFERIQEAVDAALAAD